MVTHHRQRVIGRTRKEFHPSVAWCVRGFIGVSHKNMGGRGGVSDPLNLCKPVANRAGRSKRMSASDKNAS